MILSTTLCLNKYQDISSRNSYKTERFYCIHCLAGVNDIHVYRIQLTFYVATMCANSNT